MAIVRLALPSRNQDLGRAGLGGIGVEAAAFLESLALAELVGAGLAIRRGIGTKWTDRSPRHHRAGPGEPRQRITRILHGALGACVEIVERLARALRGHDLVEQLAHFMDQAGIFPVKPAARRAVPTGRRLAAIAAALANRARALAAAVPSALRLA